MMPFPEQSRRGRLALLLAALGGLGVTAATAPGPRPQEWQRTGRPADAVAAYLQAAESYQKLNDNAGFVTAALGLAAAYQALGQHCSATAWLERARPLAEAGGDAGARLRVEAALGNAYFLARRLDAGEILLRRSLDQARTFAGEVALAGIELNLANLLVAKEPGRLGSRRRDVRGLLVSAPPATPDAAAEAATLYRSAAQRARAAGARDLFVKALLNQGRAALREGELAEAWARCREAWEEMRKEGAGAEHALHLVSCGQLAAELARTGMPERVTALELAVAALRTAVDSVDAAGAGRAVSFAYGLWGELYLEERRWAEAMRLTEKALFEAQRHGLADAQFQWEWQAARILAGQGRTGRALEVYRQAIATLHAQRSDVAVGLAQRGRGATFRQAVGRVYLELADLLLRRAEAAGDEEARQRDLREARATVEMLKSVELEDYFLEEDCANLVRTKARSIDAVEPGVAALYAIPLPDRLELLLTLPGGMGIRRVAVAVGADVLAAQARRLRTLLEDPDATGHEGEARRLWEWLLAPVEPWLEAARVHTLLVIPDGALRLIPLAALYDGRRYLIEKYAVAVAPGLSLLEPVPRVAGPRQVLLCGVASAVQGYPALEFVPAELEQVAASLGGRRLLNQDFTLRAFEKEFRAAPFSIVHLASHGEFGPDASRTFILTHDGRLTLDRLEALLLPRMLSAQPIELLTLSACQTAVGDDRAALGLAGVAVKSGARSALASLWYIHDEAAQRVMAAFYAALGDTPAPTKAEALRRAQRGLLAEPRFRHPCFWSPYLLIGNWH